MLRKLIAFAITSGLAKKAWDHYWTTKAARRASTTGRTGRRKPATAARTATTVKPRARAAR